VIAHTSRLKNIPSDMPIDPNTCKHVFFMHMPKTGGISLAAFLRGLFKPEEICPPPGGDGRWRHRPHDVSHFRFFAGHFSIDFIDALDPAGYKITILREPRQRVVSVYDFWRSIESNWSAQLSDSDQDAPSFAKSVEFPAFLRTDKDWVIEGISNSMSRQLLGERYASIANNARKAAKAAFDRLQTFDWFTTTAALTEDVASLASAFGVPHPGRIVLNKTYAPYTSENRVAVARTVPSAADLREIDRSNLIDATLYRMAARYRAQRQGGSYPRSMLSALRRAGAAVFMGSGARQGPQL